MKKMNYPFKIFETSEIPPLKKCTKVCCQDSSKVGAFNQDSNIIKILIIS